MASGVVLNSMSGGDTCAADDIDSKKYQRFKLIHGVDGVNDGDVATTNGLPVKQVLNTVDYGGAATGTLFTNQTATGFSEILNVTGLSFVVVKTEFENSSDSITVEPWRRDANAASGWGAGASITVTSTSTASGDGPASAACLGGAYFGKPDFNIDCRGFSQVCVKCITAPSTSGVYMWGDPV